MEGVSGKYLEDSAIIKSSNFSLEENSQETLWKITWSMLEEWVKNETAKPLE